MADDIASSISVSVAVIGGGPAGLAAATRIAAAHSGKVVLLERDTVVGGIPRHCGHSPFGMREYHRILSGTAYASRLERDALAAGVEILTRHSVTAIEDGTILAATPGGMRRISAEKIVLATGIRETPRSARLVTGDRPIGVINTGALQAYVHLHKLAPFKRPVIVGSELVAMSAILTCLSAGIRPAAVVEENQTLTARFPFRLLPYVLRIPVLRGAKLVDVSGGPRVDAITVEVNGKSREVPCDGVIFAGKFTPESALARISGIDIDPASGGPRVDHLGRTSHPDIFAAGNLLRPVETAGWCWSEGRAVADAVLLALAGRLPAPDQRIESRAGRGVKLVVPQSFGREVTARALGDLQVRLSEVASGRLDVSDESGVIWSRHIDSAPERRILIPLDNLRIGPSTTHLTVAVTPSGD